MRHHGDPLGITPLARLVAGSSFDANGMTVNDTPVGRRVGIPVRAHYIVEGSADDGANEFVALLETNADS